MHGQVIVLLCFSDSSDEKQQAVGVPLASHNSGENEDNCSKLVTILSAIHKDVQDMKCLFTEADSGDLVETFRTVFEFLLRLVLGSAGLGWLSTEFVID